MLRKHRPTPVVHKNPRQQNRPGISDVIDGLGCVAGLHYSSVRILVAASIRDLSWLGSNNSDHFLTNDIASISAYSSATRTAVLRLLLPCDEFGKKAALVLFGAGR